MEPLLSSIALLGIAIARPIAVMLILPVFTRLGLTGFLRVGVALALSLPVVAHLGLAGRCRVLVAGDTLARRKPDPAPVLHACAELGVDPAHTAFVGDDRRDVEAGRSAGTHTFVVAWGYLDGGDPRGWGADAIVETPAALARLLVAD